MFYVVSIALVVLALVGVVVVAVRVGKALRTVRATASMVSARTNDRVGMLRARSAAVGVALSERRSPRR